MKWAAVGATGELIGALVVVATLIYLATQVKQNTLALRSNGELAGKCYFYQRLQGGTFRRPR